MLIIDDFIGKIYNRLERLCFKNFGWAVGAVFYIYDLWKSKLKAHPVKCYNGDKGDTIRA